MDLLVLAIAFVVILLGAELFTNGIEWFGRKLELAEGAVGSILAAAGTALPETMIPIIAILFSGGDSESAHEVGIGAMLGAPFMLSTLAMFVTGLGVLAFRRRRATGSRMVVDTVVPGGRCWSAGSCTCSTWCSWAWRWRASCPSAEPGWPRAAC